jgi:hypothetical protein
MSERADHTGPMRAAEIAYIQEVSAMVTQSPTLTGPAPAARERAPLHRTLGTLGMLGSPFLFLSFAAVGFEQERLTRLGSSLGLVFALSWLANILGLQALRATGTRLFGAIVLGVELVGVVLACLFQVYEIAAPNADTLLYRITDVAWPLSMLMLIFVGIAAIRARMLRGWARFVPLACGVWLPVSILVGGVAGTMAGLIVGSLHVALGWFLLGAAIRTGGTARDY